MCQCYTQLGNGMLLHGAALSALLSPLLGNEGMDMWQISSVMSTCSALIIVTNMDSFDASDAGLALACAPANR